MARRPAGQNLYASLQITTSPVVATRDLAPSGVIYARADAEMLFRKSRNIKRTPKWGCRSLLPSAAVTFAMLTAGLFGITVPQPVLAATADPDCTPGTAGVIDCPEQ